jgi:acyl-CoA synthetase (NDP forming)
MLDALFRPKSIAVIGASENPLSIGHMVLKNLLDHGFKGPVYPVNPKSPEILGEKAYKTVSEIPGDVELVNISIKNTFVPMALEDCGKKGVKFAIIHTAGFKETGEEGIKLEKQILETADKYGMRLYGPNSQGIENSDEDVSVYANFTFTPMTKGSISIVAQSGGVGEVLQLQLKKLNTGIRMYASYGNECDVSMNEILEYYGQDDGTKVILIHIETLKDPDGFIEIAKKVSRIKPILAVKSGKTKEGLKAVSSHTGTLMEKDITTDVIFEKAGIIRFDGLDDMIQTAIALSMQPEPKNNRIALITNTGGPAILAVDECILSGLELAKLTDGTMNFLKEQLYPEASVINPVDVLATATPEQYSAVIDALMKDINVGSILISFITAKFVDVPGIINVFADWSKKATKPMVCVIMTIEDADQLMNPIRKAGVPVFEYPETGAKVLVNMARFADVKHAPEREYKSFYVDKAKVEAILGKCKKGYIQQADAFAILGAYGIPHAKTMKVSDIDSFKAAAESLKFPVVMKVDASDIVHKTDEGGLRMNIPNEATLREVYEEFTAKFAKHDPAFIVQEQLSQAIEIIIGVNNTENVGPIVMFGLGGVFVEVMKDVVFRLAPLSIKDANDMIRSIKGVKILEGVRGKKGACVDSLQDVLLRISQLASDFPQIAEMDLNPVFTFGPGEGSKVVDVRIRIK